MDLFFWFCSILWLLRSFLISLLSTRVVCKIVLYQRPPLSWSYAWVRVVIRKAVKLSMAVLNPFKIHLLTPRKKRKFIVKVVNVQLCHIVMTFFLFQIQNSITWLCLFIYLWNADDKCWKHYQVCYAQIG